jgi:hypothetical protein
MRQMIGQEMEMCRDKHEDRDKEVIGTDIWTGKRQLHGKGQGKLQRQTKGQGKESCSDRHKDRDKEVMGINIWAGTWQGQDIKTGTWQLGGQGQRKLLGQKTGQE